MSFILDALKKSENERQRHVGPSLADVRIRRRQSDRPWWVVAVAGLLVVNLGVLIVVLTRDDRSAVAAATVIAQPQPAAAQSPSSSPPSIPPARRQAQVLTAPATHPGVRSLADEAGEFDLEPGSPPTSLYAASAVPEGPPIVRAIDPPSVEPAPSEPLFESRVADNEILPTHNALVASGTNLPQLHLDIHVNSKDAAERFVFVNMRKYVEGEALREGPTVEHITAEGVVLNQRGLRFLLPRQ